MTPLLCWIIIAPDRDQRRRLHRCERRGKRRNGRSCAQLRRPGPLAAACQARGVGLLHVSTDYVFDGTPGQAPYAETAATNPLNVYARTKHEGEQAILDVCDTALILRAAWIFDERGGSFSQRHPEPSRPGAATQGRR
ncbi:MAG: sugar nucleotide-binding protein [Oceanicaulis sp.]|nr:sugar nucleotide-binding protein [Oceanicaulis sp.]